MRLNPLASIIYLALILAAGCGGSEQPTAPVAALEPAAAPNPPSIDACAIVTEADASEVFDQPATPDVGHGGVTMIAQCLWTWDTDTSNQLLQFHLWNPKGYDMPQDAEPLDVGENGFIRRHPVAGVDIGWLQDGAFVTLAYSTIGPDAPKATDRAERLIALARRVESRL